MLEYYTQRATDGGLIIGEATNISMTSRGWLGAPGLYSDAQVAGWGPIVEGVHAKGGFMFAQLWPTGRAAHVGMTGGQAPVTASVNPAYWLDASHLVSAPGGWVPASPHRALSVREIEAIVQDHRRSAERAQEAGFDGVELHAANGYLIDQFLQDGSNGAKMRTGAGVAYMPDFGAGLTDEEIAAVSNYVIAHFGGKAGRVTVRDVSKARKAG